MRHLADTTGARYYRVADPADFPKVFEAIYTDAVKPVVGCWIEYTSSCTGKARREIDLSLANICSGDATKTKSFTVLDSPIIAGPKAVCLRTMETYAVPYHPGSRYLWETGTEDANGLWMLSNPTMTGLNGIRNPSAGISSCASGTVGRRVDA